MQIKELAQVKIESLNYSANAVGRYNDFVVFVPYGVPGDILLSKIRQVKRNYAIGEFVEIIQPSPFRCQPECIHFIEGCGGCQWQNIDYQCQLEWKKDIVNQALLRIGKINNIPEIEIYSEYKPMHYRNKLRIFSKFRSSNTILGMKKHNTHELVPIKQCLISDQRINDIIRLSQMELSSSENSITEITIRITNTGQTMLVCKYSKDNRNNRKAINRLINKCKPSSTHSIIDKEIRLENGLPSVTENIYAKTYNIGPDSFFQVNYYGLNRLIEIVKEAIGYENKLILDAHCGVGTFAIQLADKCNIIYGTDISSSAIELANQNARDNHLDNVFFQKGSAVRILNGKLHSQEIDMVILDPPRDGCDKLDLISIINSKPKKIAYISCNPTTLARDMKEITDAGYKLLRLAVIDMFPMTYHLETIAICEN